ncbi:MAG TPA: IS3 family transposase [Faecalibacter sp.]
MKSSDLERKMRTQLDYTLGFKLAVVSQVEKGDFTYKQAQKCYGIQGRSTVLVWLRKPPNLYKEIKINKLKQVFVSDITYVKNKQAVCYFSLVTDAYSRKVMGYSVGKNMNAENVSMALKMAIKYRVNNEKLIHHSDRGLQYCSEYYQTILKQNQIIPSMTDGYDCYQNALAERINGILKQEFLIEKTKDITELTKMVEQSVYLYNNTRPHLSLNMQTPEMRHKKSEEIKSLRI